MDNELSNILENTTPKQHGINISQISKDKLKNIIDDNENGSLYEVDEDSEKKNNKFLLKSKEKEDKEEKSKDKDGKSKEEKKKLKEEAKEEEKKKKEEEKKKKEEEKKRKEEEKKRKEEEKKKEKEEKKKEKEGKKLKEKGNKDIDESVTGSNGFLYRFLHKNTVKDKICSIDNLNTNNDSSKGSKDIFGKELDNDKFKSKSQPLFNSKKQKDESTIDISEKSSNVNSIINLLENKKFGSNYSSNESHESASGSHDEFICKNKVKKNIKLFSHKKFNTVTESNNNDNPIHEANNEIKTSFSLGQIQKDESNLSIINDQSTSSNNGLLVMKKVAAPPKRRPPTKQKLMENAETAFTQRTGDDPIKLVNSPETSYTNFKDILSHKLPSNASLKENNCIKESSSKELNEICEEKNDDDDDDDDKSLFNDNSNSGNIFDIKKRMTKKLISKQKFSDKLYPGGENCDSNIVESKSILSITDISSRGSISEKEESFVNSPMDNIKITKNASFNNGPVPPFRKERSVNLGGGFKAPKSPSSGNISVSSLTTNSITPMKKMSIPEDNKKLLVTPRISAKSKRRPPSHIGIAKNSKETIFTLKEDGEDKLLCPSNQESYMTNIKISEVKIAKKIDQKQINVLKLPSKGPAMIDSSNIIEEAKKETTSNSIKALQKSDSSNSLQSNNNNNNENNEIKEGKKSNYHSNRSSMHPNFLSELDGQLSKRSSIKSNVNIEEKMQEIAKKKRDQEEEDNNKNIFNVILKSKGTNFENKSPCEDSNSNSELVNSPFFKKRANIVNLENEENKSINDEKEKEIKGNNEFDFSVIKLKSTKRIDDNQINENSKKNDEEENLAIETPTLVKPSNFQKNNINKLKTGSPIDSPVRSSPNTPHKSKFKS